MRPEQRQALILAALRARPSWTIRAIVRTGRGAARRAVAEFHGHLPQGYARDAAEAVAKYRALNPTLPAGLELVAVRGKITEPAG